MFGTSSRMFIRLCITGRDRLIHRCGGDESLKEGQGKRRLMQSTMRLLLRLHQKCGKNGHDYHQRGSFDGDRLALLDLYNGAGCMESGMGRSMAGQFFEDHSRKAQHVET